MAEIVAISLISIVAAIGIACAINYFLDCGPWRALGVAFFTVIIFLLFAASGLWADTSRYDWGKLTPIFALMLVGGWIALKYGKRIWHWWRHKYNSHKEE